MLKMAQAIIFLILLANSYCLIGCNKDNNMADVPVSQTPARTPVSGPIRVELSIPYAPALNQAVDVTCTVSSIYDITDLTVTVKSRRRVITRYDANIEQPYIAGDNTTQVFNLKANQPVSFSSKIVFKETGFWRITASVGYAPVADKYSYDKADLYLTINADNGVMGWSFPAPPISPQVPPEPPPAVLLDDTRTHVEKSYEAKTYTNEEYCFSLQYPNNWVERPELVTTPFRLAAFSVQGFVPGVIIAALDADAPMSVDWALKSFNNMGYQKPEVVSPLLQTILADGTKANTYKVRYITQVGYPVTAFCLDADRCDKRIRVEVFTIDAFAPYDETLFSEIAHTLTFECTCTNPATPIISTDNQKAIESTDTVKDPASKIYPGLKKLMSTMKPTDTIYVFAHLKEMDASTAQEIEKATAAETQATDAINNEIQQREQAAREEFEKEFGVAAQELLRTKDSAAVNRYQEILKEYGADLDSKNLLNAEIYNLWLAKESKVSAIQKQHYPEILARAKLAIEALSDTKVLGTGRYWGPDCLYVRTRVGRINTLTKIPDVTGLEDGSSGQVYMSLYLYEIPESTWYPTLLTPNNGFIGCPVNRPSFSWKPFKETTKYKFVLATDAAMTQVVKETELNTTSYEYDGTLDYSTNYFWWVMGLEPSPTDWSATFSFQTAAAPMPVPPETPPQPTTWPPTLIAIIVMTALACVGTITWLIIAREKRAK